MSGVLSIPNTFQNAVTATGLQLDQDFNTVTAYANDPTNRNNYAADGAATNTVNLTFSPPVLGGYTAGLELTWKWGVTQTGGTLLNANGLGNISLLNPDGSALQSGQGIVGSIGKAVYDGTRAIYLTPPSPATKAQMQTATASASFVSPAQTQNHPGVAKAWAYFPGTVTGTIVPLASYNIASIVRGGLGTYTVVLSVGFPTTAWAAVTAPGGNAAAAQVNSQTASSAVVLTINSAGSLSDSNFVSFAAFGNQ